MKNEQQTFASRISGVMRLSWILTGLVVVLTTENIWIEPWIRSRVRRFPSFVPAALSGWWFFDLAFCGIALLLLLMCTVAVVRGRGLPLSSKVMVGSAFCVVLLLVLDWYGFTSGQSSIPLAKIQKPHSVTLTWGPSGSEVFGYNLYRSSEPGGHYRKLNDSVIQSRTFTDAPVENGANYYYMVRAVDAAGRESSNSNEIFVKIPK